ncbi:MAG: hypothetical protein ACLFTK_04530 [Anaerolineales bacterium]
MSRQVSAGIGALAGLVAALTLVNVAAVVWLPPEPHNTPTIFQAVVIFVADIPLFGLWLVLFGLAWHTPERAETLLAGRWVLPWVGLVIWAAVSALWAPAPVLALWGAFHLLLGLCLALVIANGPPSIRRAILWGLVLGGTLQATVALGQIVTNAPLGLYALGEPRFPYRNPAGIMRAYGLNSNPNQLAGYLVLTICASWALWRETPRARGGLMAACGVMLLGVVASGSRTAALGLAGGLATVAPPGVGLLALGLGGALVLARALLWDPAGDPWGEIVNRLTFAYADTWTIIRAHPLLGAGMGGLILAIGMLYAPNTYILPAHNAVLIGWAELGLPGLGLLAWGYGAALWQARPPWRAAWVALGIIFCFDFYLWSDTHMRTLGCIALGCLWAPPADERPAS